MTRQLEAKAEERQARRDKAVLSAVCGGLHDAVGYAGGELVGLSVRIGFRDCLIVLKAEFPAGPQVAFVGSESLDGALIKGVREARGGTLSWRPDQYK
jgi:hypothetical protein